MTVLRMLFLSSFAFSVAMVLVLYRTDDFVDMPLTDLVNEAVDCSGVEIVRLNLLLSLGCGGVTFESSPRDGVTK
jgi:hypothetical protein